VGAVRAKKGTAIIAGRSVQSLAQVSAAKSSRRVKRECGARAEFLAPNPQLPPQR